MRISFAARTTSPPAALLRREEGEAEEEREGADHDVAVDRDHADGRPRGRGCARARAGRSPPESRMTTSNAEERGHGLRRRSSPSRRRRRQSRDLRTRSEAEGDVDAVQHGLQEEAVAGAAEADQPAEDDVVGERERRGEDADAEIGLRRRLHALAAADEFQRQRDDRILEDENGEAEDERQNQRAVERRLDLACGRRRRPPGRRGRSCRRAGN